MRMTVPDTERAEYLTYEHSWLSPRRRRDILTHPDRHHPSSVTQARRHAASMQLRIADAITAFAGSMWFVYVHIALFLVWMLFIERNPWPTLTLVVSLEAIFLSCFVMIGQNRSAAFQQQKADHDFNAQEKELDENTRLTREIHRLTVELHRLQTQPASAAVPPSASPAPGLQGSRVTFRIPDGDASGKRTDTGPDDPADEQNGSRG